MVANLLDLIEEGKSSFDLDFFETQVIQSNHPIEVDDVNDDIKIEVELYKNALESVKKAYSNFEKSSKPFFRPNDYFAEMVKSDSHMEKVRLRLVEESERLKASEESKKKRELKKFGKAIQVENKLQREKESKRIKESVQELRKKRKDGSKLDEKKGDEEFEIELEETLSNPKKRARAESSKDRHPKKKPRSVRESKFGHPKPKGVTGKRWKENTKESSNNFKGLGGKGDGRVSSGPKRGGRGGKATGSRSAKPRLGKSKRQKR